MECAQNFSLGAIRNLALIENDTTVIFAINYHGMVLYKSRKICQVVGLPLGVYSLLEGGEIIFEKNGEVVCDHLYAVSVDYAKWCIC